MDYPFELFKENKILPRNVFATNLRQATGHDCLPEHLHRINLFSSDKCTRYVYYEQAYLLVCECLDREKQGWKNFPGLIEKQDPKWYKPKGARSFKNNHL